MKKQKDGRNPLENQFQKLLGKIYQATIRPLSQISVRFFKKKNIKQIIGLQVAVGAFSVAIFPSLTAIAQTELYQKQNIFAISEEIKTERSVRLPLESFTITQGYSFFHPGIDLATTKGTPVFPIMEGVVTFVGRGRFGFGNHVIIDHGNGLKSLYAHLAKIEVQEGEKITKDSVVGLLGSTGRSTGPHLHLQIWQDNHLVNPRAFFEGYFGQKLTSTR